jgi:hypothetical protein
MLFIMNKETKSIETTKDDCPYPLDTAINYIRKSNQIPEWIINERKKIEDLTIKVFEAIDKAVIEALGDMLTFVEHDDSDDVETDYIRYNFKHNEKERVFRIGTDFEKVMKDIRDEFGDYPLPEITLHISEWREDEDGEPDEFGLLFTTIFIDNDVARLSCWFNGTDGIGYDVYIETDKLKEEFKFLLDAIREIPILEHIYEGD